MTDLPKFEIIKDEIQGSLLIQFEHTEWVDYEKAADILSLRLLPILQSYVHTMMNERGIRAVEASIRQFLGAMVRTEFLFQRRGKWDLDEEW